MANSFTVALVAKVRRPPVPRLKGVISMYFKQPDGVSVHSGFPNPAADGSLQPLDLNQLLIHNGASTFFMRIQGNNWAEQGIFDGDLVIIDRAISPKSNDIVVWYEADNFVLSPKHQVPSDVPVWGLVTSVTHQFREKPRV
jgi:hypothetical protein